MQQYNTSRHFGTYSSAFFSAMTKNTQKLLYKSKREEGVELNTGSNLINENEHRMLRKCPSFLKQVLILSWE